jgi:Asp-tRNA(Asn)/Glu-tRNA(Gln) amidotransferase A subunit family amidase
VIAGPDERDPTTIQEAPPSADLKMDDFAPPRIGVVRNFYPERTEPVMQDAIESAAARFRAADATVGDFLLPEQFGLSWHAANLVGAEGAVFNLGQQILQGQLPQRRAAELVPATYYVQARRIRTWLTGMLQDMMAGVDALMMAVAPGAAPKGLASTGDASLLVPWSFLGFPAITVNAGLSPEGLPLGIQLVATPRADWDLLRTGAWAEATLGRLPAPVVG